MACVLLVGLWLLSGWRHIYWRQYLGDGEYQFHVSAFSGFICASCAVHTERCLTDWDRRGDVNLDSQFGVRPVTLFAEVLWRFPDARCTEGLPWDKARPDNKRVACGYWRGVKLPIWIPLLGIAIPTAWLWWRDRRFPSDHCQNCGYNLTGNVSGRCPECGEAI